MNKFHFLFASLFYFTLSACNQHSTQQQSANNKATLAPNVQTMSATYKADTAKMIGYMAYDASFKTKRPVVIIVPEWWGLNDYAKGRARQLAEMGYLAFAIDMYGNAATADNPELAGKLAGPFYQQPKMAQQRFESALQMAKRSEFADTNQVAAIGYCFGGAQVINMAKLGVKLNGVVSFHGNLNVVPADKNLLAAPILVCHGAADKFVSDAEVLLFKKQMDSIGANYSFKSYPDATHAFTNPGATAMGQKFSIPIAYNAAADASSWQDMKAFFARIFK